MDVGAPAAPQVTRRRLVALAHRLIQVRSARGSDTGLVESIQWANDLPWVSPIGTYALPIGRPVSGCQATRNLIS